MPDLNWELLKTLCDIPAVSGREDAMIAFLKEQLEPLADEIEVDNLGNVTAVLAGDEHPETRLMLQAHIDELGLIVRDITADGFLRIERVGGIPEKSLLAQRVEVITDDGHRVPGYVGTKSHHVTGPEEKRTVPRILEMFIDVGLSTREEVEELGIQVGDPVAYHPNFHRFGDGVICSKALDDRVGIYVLLEVLKRLHQQRPPSTVVFAFTVLEEFSIRGSLPAVRRVDPHAILSVDITIATDTPMEERRHPVRLRHGPAIKMMDFHGRGTLGGLFSSPKLRRFIEGLASDGDIPLQREVIVGVITDPAFQLYLGERGYVIAGLSVPQRYSHASIQMCHERDIVHTVNLLEMAAREFGPDLDLSRG